MAGFLTRLRSWIWPKPGHGIDEIDEEVRFHLEEQRRANLAAGMTPGEAYRQAMIGFGGVEKARRGAYQQRPGFFLESVLEDLRYSLRGCARNPVFTITVVLTLMLGIGATTAVFSMVDRILFRSLPYRDAERLVSLGMVHSVERQEFLMGNFYYDWRDHQKSFEAMTSESVAAHECDLTTEKPAQLNCEPVETNFLQVLGVTPVLGRNFLPEEGRPGGADVAILSYGFWQSHFNRDPGILARGVSIDGRTVRVVGILPKEFEMPRLQAVEVLFPLVVDEAADRGANGGFGRPRRALARLKPGISVERARVELEPLFQDALRVVPAQLRYDVHLKVRSLRDRQMQDARLTAWVLLGAVLAVLVIACVNVASLLMARGASRARELAVRSALGASRGRLARLALTEAMVLSAGGAVAGCGVAEALLRYFKAIGPASIPYLAKSELDLRVAGFAGLLTLLCGVLAGLAPALRKPSREALQGRSGRLVSQARFRQWLVVLQIAASTMLLAAAMLLLRSFSNLENQKLGMRDDSTLTVRLTLGEHTYPKPQSMLAFYQELERRLRFGPGVSEVAATDSLPPISEGHDVTRLDQIEVEGRPPRVRETGAAVSYRMVSPDYFRLLDIPMVEGEGFRERDLTSAEPVVVLSRLLASILFPGERVVGRRIRFGSGEGDSWYRVAGVAADVKNGGLTGEQEPEYYQLRRSLSGDWDRGGSWGRTFVMMVRSSAPPRELSGWIRGQLGGLDPTLPVDMATLRERTGRLADEPRFETALVGFFAAIGLGLAMIGLYGLMAYVVIERRQEIGVRMALGADRGNVLWLVAGRSLRLMVAGLAAGLVGAAGATRVLAKLLYGVDPHDPVTFGWAVAVMMVVGMLAAAGPVWSAMRVDPVVALRSE